MSLINQILSRPNPYDELIDSVTHSNILKIFDKIQDPKFKRWAIPRYGDHILLRAGKPENANKIILPDGTTQKPKFPVLYDWEITYLDLDTLLLLMNNPGDLIFIYGWPLWYTTGKLRRIKYPIEEHPEWPPLLNKQMGLVDWFIRGEDVQITDEETWVIRNIIHSFDLQTLLVMDVDGSELSPMELLERLPIKTLTESRCLVQFTASQGLPGKEGKYYFRLWWELIPGVHLNKIIGTAMACKNRFPEIDTNIYKHCHPIAISPPKDLRSQKNKIQRAFIIERKYPACILNRYSLDVSEISWQRNVYENPPKPKTWWQIAWEKDRKLEKLAWETNFNIKTFQKKYSNEWSWVTQKDLDNIYLIHWIRHGCVPPEYSPYGKEEKLSERQDLDFSYLRPHLPYIKNREKIFTQKGLWHKNKDGSIIPKKQQNNRMIEKILKEKREKIGAEGHHKQILDFAIAMRKYGYSRKEMMQELREVMKNCDRMGKSPGEWRANYDNDNYRRNVINWVCRNVKKGKEGKIFPSKENNQERR